VAFQDPGNARNGGIPEMGHSRNGMGPPKKEKEKEKEKEKRKKKKEKRKKKKRNNKNLK
jgi:hypothetical protein